MRDELRSTTTLVFGLAVILGSCQDQPPVAPNNTEATNLKNQSGPVHYKTAQNSISAVYTGYVQRRYPYCDVSDSITVHYGWKDCQPPNDVVFSVWGTGGPSVRCGTSNPIFDFDTRFLPDDAVIEHGVTLKVWYAGNGQTSDVSAPPDPECNRPAPGSAPT